MKQLQTVLSPMIHLRNLMSSLMFRIANKKKPRQKRNKKLRKKRNKKQKQKRNQKKN